MSKHIEFTAGSGACGGELAEPPGSGKVGTVVVVHDWRGINDDMRSKVERFAGEGFLALAPDLHHGKVAANDDEAKRLMEVVDFGRAVGEIASALERLKEHPRSNGKAGVIGFSLGGALTFATAASVPGITCAVAFYGVVDRARLDLEKVTAPIQAHFVPHDDDWASPDKARQIQKELEAIGKSMELHVYEGARHSFMRQGDKATYHEASAKKAWERALHFLHRHLQLAGAGPVASTRP